MLENLPYDEVVQSVEEYCQNDKAHIEFNDLSYTSFEDPFGYYD